MKFTKLISKAITISVVVLGWAADYTEVNLAVNKRFAVGSI